MGEWAKDNGGMAECEGWKCKEVGGFFSNMECYLPVFFAGLTRLGYYIIIFSIVQCAGACASSTSNTHKQTFFFFKEDNQGKLA